MGGEKSPPSFKITGEGNERQFVCVKRMIARYGEGRYIDVDLISAIEGEYTDSNPKQWWTKLVCNGVPGVINGPDGKNIMDAFEWKWKHAITDMIPGNPTYKKKLNQ